MSSSPIMVFADTQYLGIGPDNVYTSPSGGAGSVIDKLTTTNMDVATRTVAFYIYPPSESPTGTEFAIKQKQLVAGQCYLWPEMVGQALAAGGAVYVECDAPGVVTFRMSGREYTED